MTVIVHTPTNNLENSLDFYQRLEYKVVSEKKPTLLTNGKALLEINPDRFARAGLKMYKYSWAEELKSLEELTTIHKTETGHLINDLNGCWVYLIEGKPEHTIELTDSSYGLTGNFRGLSLESAEMDKSADVWQILGFKITMGTAEKGFVVMANEDGFGLSLMKPMTCPHLFFNPSMTFFNGQDNLAIIENIRKANIPIAEEITHFNKDGIVDNIIIRDPGGYGFFIFSD
ncbi:MAG: hypothetical protein ACI85F_000834 [Bacteroidia bacterium]|jgi:hypothetical protein